MPPKSKKQQQEEAKRVEEENRIREELEAKAALQRKKYAGETLHTGLFLPVSAQLVTDFGLRPYAFFEQKLQDVLIKHNAIYKGKPEHLKFIIKMVGRYIYAGRSLFTENKRQGELTQAQLTQIRIFAAILLQALLQGKQELGHDVTGKSRQADQKIIKARLLETISTWTGIETAELLTSIKKTYFDHYLLVHNYHKFPTRMDVQETYVYIATPSCETNYKQTQFVNLAQEH